MAVYLDHAATTPMLPGVLDAMLPFLGERHENPSSAHRGARAVRRAIDDARDAMAELAGCEPGELIWTSGGTESDNLAILGVDPSRPGGVVVSAIEHHAVLEPARSRDAAVAPVSVDGRLDLDRFASLLSVGTVLVSVMAVNNETGVRQPLGEVFDLVHERAPDALIHCDAVQAAPWCDVASWCAPADLVSLSAHKFGGPKGVGALVVRPRARARLAARLVGGAQESALRAGTENVAGIVGAGTAAIEWGSRRDEIATRVRTLRDDLEDRLVGLGAGLNAPRDDRVASIAPVCFSGFVTEELLVALDDRGVAASAGAACASGALEPSHVLMAMGLPPAVVDSSLRLSLGWPTTPEEIDHAVGAFREVLAGLGAPARSR